MAEAARAECAKESGAASQCPLVTTLYKWDQVGDKEINTGGTGEAKSMSKKSANKTNKKVFARPGDDMTDEELKAFSKEMYKLIMGHDEPDDVDKEKESKK